MTHDCPLPFRVVPAARFDYALLLTDVVGSTQLSETLGDAVMAQVWAQHDRAARDLLVRWRGREIDKTDGMLLLFGAAADALSYAHAYHRALAALTVPLLARAGLHVGPVVLRENPLEDVARGAKPLEVDGLAKPMAARVMALARGGQTLLTPDARQALGDAGLAAHSHGHWVMKGVTAPIELFEAGIDAAAPAACTAPPDGDKAYRVVQVDGRWLPAREIPNNLPQQATSFIGRERELDALKDALGQARLITLLGMGGLGKTRLSLQVAAELLAEFPDGAWFVDLSPIRDPALVLSEAAQVLNVREEPGRPLLHTLCAHLASRRLLLLFDNCEHLIQPAADLAHALLRAAPGVRIVASSREALRVPGEQVVPILPLPVPARGDSLAVLAQSTAVRLFIDRAQMHQPAFALTEREAPALAELVARLEGIPLALELAAARVRVLSVADINRRLADRYKLLTGGSRVLQPRQQTLRALVDWSYELLGPPEQTVFKRLAVFAGGFDLAAAEAVCGVEPLDSLEVMDLLASLVDKSLVSMKQRSGDSRYAMLDTLRDYAQEKLATGGETVPTAARHAAHFFSLSKQVRDGLQGPEQARWLDQAEVEVDNVRAAVALALQGAVEPEMAIKLAMNLQSFWLLRGYAGEGRSAVRAALALPAVQQSDSATARGLYIGAVLASGQSDHAEARQMLQVRLAVMRRLGQPMELAVTLSTLALAQLQGGDAAAARSSEQEALHLFQGIGHRQGEAIGHLHLGQCAVVLGDDAMAATHLAQGLALAQGIGWQEIVAECQLELGLLALATSDTAASLRHLADSLQVSQASGNRRGEACAVWGLGRCDLQAGDAAAARARVAQVLPAFRQFGMREQQLGALEDAARATALGGELNSAAALAAAADQARLRLALPRPARAEAAWQAQTRAWHAALTRTGEESAVARGRAWSIDEATDAAVAGLLQPVLTASAV